ncbi:cysteine desulfuration protein SufE [Enterobacteriaceae endosymbiont of Neohaemonia nigricornis]|uniref:cysteine desulfuration protein SufE n=1 Tax=Enterobacteriaceae endosymbiont of Neohaemonia nigricornis TaxID=2675792 RepID=UPI00144A06DB|nr:cysteine desulfuration protein SufE [Enterobacteriaceae endosymbiont of Neohaemonia nigricornis]QJC30532.1 cysteine desulfuration protein SufE [Enterobacteriaceae endosymbiont of Neohaemonia nigricornis]
MKIYPIINRNIMEKNFLSCSSWEEKYLYIIELGNNIPYLSSKAHSLENFIPGCQSQVWISIKIQSNNYVIFHGDSDSAIVKGLLTMIFIFYENKTYNEIIKFNINLCFKKLNLNKYLTISRLQGIETIIQTIKNKLTKIVQYKL